jgi:hypothetical protein
MRRREFLAGAVGAAGALGASAAAARTAPAACTDGLAAAPIATPAVYLIPGYKPAYAHYRGRPILEARELRGNLPLGYDGHVTMLIRVSEADGSVRHTLMPIRGHAITPAPNGAAFWNSLEGSTMLLFDPVTLEVGALLGLDEGFFGGGHGRFTADGKHLVVSERRGRESYTGTPADHYGRLTIRDAQTLQLVESYGCGGMQPHDLALLPDGRHAIVSNYGSFLGKDDWRPLIVEPSLTVVDIESGRLVDKRVNSDHSLEVRHLAAGGLDRVAAILARRGSFAEEEALLSGVARAYPPDQSAGDGGAYMPAPVERYDLSTPDGGSVAVLPEDPLHARYGQSILYDSQHDEFIATFTTSSTVIVFAGDSGAVRKVTQTEPLGLRYPRGIALHPDGIHYAVSGAWDNLVLFERGTHAHAPGRTIFLALYEHSHIAALPA